MISKNITYQQKKPRTVSPGQAAFRIGKSIAQPIIVLIMALAVIVSFFEPKEGTNSRLIMLSICSIARNSHCRYMSLRMGNCFK